MTTTHHRHLLWPKLFSVLKEGYSLSLMRADVIAGLSVAIVALPLCMALGIASGGTPEQGLITGIVGGFLISMLGGSRFQIGGPAAAFIVVLLNIRAEHGFDGLLLATMMAGLMLLVAGFFRLGTYVKYIPYPVITGFTSGIAATIFITQLKDLFGFDLSSLPHAPHDAVQTLKAYGENFATFSPATLGLGGALLVLMLILRRYRPRWPIFLIGVVTGGLTIWIAQALGHPLPIATIGTRFGSLHTEIPTLQLPEISLARLQEMLPSAITVAFLAGVEALLSAVVADGMTGRHHRSNMELMAQGAANFVVPLLGGLPATGTIARTATNIRSGGQTPVSGMLHAVFLLLILLVAAPLASWIPLCSLAAVLIIVAWNISEIDRFTHLMRAPRGDRAVLVVTFLLTVFVDLSVAIKVGVLMAALLFMHRMSEMVAVTSHGGAPLSDTAEEYEDVPESQAHNPLPTALPKGVLVYQINGPFFFGAASHINDGLEGTGKHAKTLVLRMHGVPLMDGSGAATLEEIIDKTEKHGGQVVLTEVQPQPHKLLRKMHLIGEGKKTQVVPDFAAYIASLK